ncbi:hypothetical protein TYRP_022824 [Tyrophagus putrescentiae]|nr:hypothetical protein TYRP_022824 [Tyrophagus putrescentiae]
MHFTKTTTTTTSFTSLHLQCMFMLLIWRRLPSSSYIDLLSRKDAKERALDISGKHCSSLFTHSYTGDSGGGGGGDNGYDEYE